MRLELTSCTALARILAYILVMPVLLRLSVDRGDADIVAMFSLPSSRERVSAMYVWEVRCPGTE